MKVTIIVSILVMGAMLAPTSSAPALSRVKRQQSDSVLVTITIQNNLANFPNGPTLASYASGLVGLSYSDAFNISLFSLVAFSAAQQAVNLGGGGPTINNQNFAVPFGNLGSVTAQLFNDLWINAGFPILDDLCKLGFVCKAEALGGVTDCNPYNDPPEPAKSTLNKLLSDTSFQFYKNPSVIFTDGFAFISQAINLGAGNSRMLPVIAAQQALFKSMSDALASKWNHPGNIGYIADSYTYFMTNATAIGAMRI